MNPLRLFDYIFYAIFKIYAKSYGHSRISELAGIAFLSILQTFNVIIILACFRINGLNNNLMIIVILIYLIILVLNFIRYKRKVNYGIILKEWNLNSKITRLIIKIGVVVYLIITFFFMVYIPN